MLDNAIGAYLVTLDLAAATGVATVARAVASDLATPSQRRP